MTSHSQSIHSQNNQFKKRNVVVLLLTVVIGLGLIINLNLKPNSDSALLAEKPCSIGIVMPMDHVALRSMIAGFTAAIQKEYNGPVEIKVKNAQGDMNVQASILQQFVRNKTDIIVPIGSTATQMAVSITHDQKVVSLAAYLPEELQKKARHKGLELIGVLDEIGSEKPLKFLKALYPHLKKITLIYSNSEKVFPEVEQTLLQGSKNNIKVQKLMIHSLSDLYTISRLIDPDSKVIFILKDHMVVSGIQTLLREAKKRNIPILASDQGSVQEGAHLAIGVREEDIGKLGGKLSAQLLQVRTENNLPSIHVDVGVKNPVHTIDQLSVFYNLRSCQDQRIDLDNLQRIAKQSKYEVQILGDR